MTTNRSKKGLFIKVKKCAVIAVLCGATLTASAQVIGGDVFGGGNAAPVNGNTNVTIQAGDLANNVYGGGNMGTVGLSASETGNSAVTVNGGNITNDVYGGGRRANVFGYADVHISGGSMTNVFGGNDIAGTVTGDGTANSTRNGNTTAPQTASYVLVDGTPTIAQKADVGGNVFGGGNGNYEYGSGDYADLSDSDKPAIKDTYVQIATTGNSIYNVFGGGYAAPVDTQTTVLVQSGTITNNVYGGGNMGTIGTDATHPGNTDVDITGGTINGAIYAGGRQADVFGFADLLVDAEGATIGSVYGGNDITGTVQGAGDAHSARNGRPKATEDVTDNASYVRITNKPTHITNVFGGGNGDYNYTSGIYAGLTKPTMAASYVEIDMSEDGDIDTVYGGGNAATVDNSEVHLWNEGHVDLVFGGGNAATVTTSVLVDINATIDGSTENATTVFGGNNQADMAILPIINLTSGLVHTVYGGGNEGRMLASATAPNTDAFCNEISNLSTYIYVESDDIKVTDIYGGCKDADVLHNTFIDVRGTHEDGITNVFGGNDHGGEVADTRIDVINGKIANVYGGSNGNYFRATDEYYLTKTGEYAAVSATNAVPVCDSCTVNIYGGTLTNVYGGGLAGDVRRGTYLLLNDKMTTTCPGVTLASASISGNLFGGGCGVEAFALDKTKTNVGNVGGYAVTDAYHITTLTNAYLYGGGNAGNVENTLLTLHPTWEKAFKAIYGGCRASDVTGTAHTILNPASDQVKTSDLVFGGNDFAGTTANSILDIYNGKYNKVYGAGNGNYKYSEYSPLQSIAEENRKIIPVSEDVVTNLYYAVIDSNLYGGSDQGYIFKNDTTQNYTDINDYSTVITNIHGGAIGNNVFGGCHGTFGGKQLAYAVKIVNMDGGVVEYSMHGGSESVSDGYPTECIDKDNTTERPTNIINMTGGIVRNRFFGGGYMGQIYGSVYINIGKHAVDSSEVWTKTFNGTAQAYASLKPAFVESDPEGAQLMMNDLQLEKSIYSGADWGTTNETGGNSLYYDKPCFHGGKSELSIDGRDYNTSNDTRTEPLLTINESLYGSGTSSEGGDIFRIIKLKNYGEMADCQNTDRTLYSIQRADSVTIQNVNLELKGTTSDVALYSTPNYAMSRIDDELRFIDKNYIKLDAPAIYTANMTFFKHNSNNLEEVTIADLSDDVATPGEGQSCEDINTCDWRTEKDPKFTTLNIMHGYYIEVRKWQDDNNDKKLDDNAPYGAVKGYAYFLSEQDYLANIIAREKTDHTDDGGFLNSCSGNNTLNNSEIAYDTPTSNYRVWTILSGSGNRIREVNITAHKDPTYLPGIDEWQKVNTGYPTTGNASFTTDPNQMLAIAIADIALPPSNPGNHFHITNIIIDNENRTMQLANAGMCMNMNPTASDTTLWSDDGSNGATKLERVQTTINNITSDPQNYFGLTIQGWDNFDNHNPIVLSGNNYMSGTQTREIGNISSTTNNIVPTARLTLTYDPSFTNNSQRTVRLIMQEFNGETPLHPLEVVITVETLTNTLGSSEITTLAMFNDGISNEYSKKVLIPATQKDYELYLKKVEWEPYNDPNDSKYYEKFRLRDTLISTHNTATNKLAENVFALKFRLSEDISSTVKSDNAWRSLTSEWKKREADIFSLGVTGTSATNDTLARFTHIFGSESDPGTHIGELDSRFTAALDFSLLYDGTIVYPTSKIVGKATLTFNAKNILRPGDPLETFTITINVKTREHGDTIYIASADSVTRDNIRLYPWNYNPESRAIDHTNIAPDPTGANPSATNKVMEPGKYPDRYVQSFDDALNRSITGYDEGDVLCILDTVQVTQDIIMRGTDYSIVQVVRYDGRHYMFPGESRAYRGPMIHVSNGANFSVWNMRFDGMGISKMNNGETSEPIHVNDNENYTTYLETSSGIQKIKNTDRETRITNLNGAFSTAKFSNFNSRYYESDKTKRVSDTTVSFGPVFLVTGDNTTLILNNGTSIVHNFNMATNEVITSGAGNIYYAGAIEAIGSNHPRMISSSSDNPLFANAPVVELVNNVEIAGNLARYPKTSTASDATWVTSGPRGAGIHIKDAALILSTHNSTAIDITKNHYVYANNNNNIVNGFGAPTGVADIANANTDPLYKVDNKYGLSDAYFTDKQLNSNVYLTRTVASDASTDLYKQSFNDNINDLMYMKSEMSENTKIGVNKWFPTNASYPRDSIQFAMAVSSQPRANAAFNKKNFVSDSNFTVYYNTKLDQTRLYFVRCDAFKLQDSLHTPGDLAAIDYIVDPSINSLNHGDTLLVHVKGAFYPRTYTWYEVNGDNTTQLFQSTSLYSNSQIKANEDGSFRKASDEGEYIIDNMDHFTPSQNEYRFHYRVKAQDLMGCTLQKDIEIHTLRTLNSSETIDGHLLDVPGYWIDKTYSGSNESAVATDNSAYNTDSTHGSHISTVKGIRTTQGVQLIANTDLATATIVGEIYGETLTNNAGGGTKEINNAMFSAGDVITLTANANDDNKQFMMWDYDPYASATTEYIIPEQTTTINAIFAPNKYWYEQITKLNETDGQYTTDYNGNVHITGPKGLAWLISVVNGKNGQQTRSMLFDTVFIEGGTYDMGEYLWTPVGTPNYKFCGTFMTNGTPVEISNIIVNEPQLNEVGLFGTINGAQIEGIKVSDATLRGKQYVGALAGRAENGSKIENNTIDNTNIITSYVSGGIAGILSNTLANKNSGNARFMGSAVYNGSIAGRGTKDSITNNEFSIYSKLTNVVQQGSVSGDIVETLNNDGDNGYTDLDGDGVPDDPTTSPNNSYIANNYIHIVSEGNVSLFGGLAATAKNAVMENNYVYGEVKNVSNSGAIIGNMGDNVTVNNCFFENGLAENAMAETSGSNTSASNVRMFSGSGNQVTVSENVDGINNLTRILNRWVRQQPAESDFNTWRSDLEGVNNGYPIFGTPDIIPVYDTLYYETCDYYDWNGDEYYESGSYVKNFIDNVEMIDSTVTLMLTINSSMLSEFADSVQLGIDYYGHGFSFTATEQELIRRTVAKEGFATIEFNDTLQTVHGCDSIVTLTLTVYDGLVSGTETPEAVTVKVYPNPTTSIVNVEATGLKEVEVYDNASRRIADSKVDSDHCIINLNNNASGSYYLRIYTEKGVAIRKVIKK